MYYSAKHDIYVLSPRGIREEYCPKSCLVRVICTELCEKVQTKYDAWLYRAKKERAQRIANETKRKMQNDR